MVVLPLGAIVGLLGEDRLYTPRMRPGEPHDGIDCHDALAGRADDQWIDLGLDHRWIIDKPRERNDCQRERIEVALGLAAEARKRRKAAHFRDHLMRRSEIDR